MIKHVGNCVKLNVVPAVNKSLKCLNIVPFIHTETKVWGENYIFLFL